MGCSWCLLLPPLPGIFCPSPCIHLPLSPWQLPQASCHGNPQLHTSPWTLKPQEPPPESSFLLGTTSVESCAQMAQAPMKGHLASCLTASLSDQAGSQLVPVLLQSKPYGMSIPQITTKHLGEFLIIYTN